MKLLADGVLTKQGYYFLVLLDEGKVGKDGMPDENYLREFVFTTEQDVKVSKREALALCREEISGVTPAAVRANTIAAMRK